MLCSVDLVFLSFFYSAYFRSFFLVGCVYFVDDCCFGKVDLKSGKHEEFF